MKTADTAMATAQRDDQELVDALRAGDANGVDTLVQRYGAWIYRVAARMLGDRRDTVTVDLSKPSGSNFRRRAQ